MEKALLAVFLNELAGVLDRIREKLGGSPDPLPPVVVGPPGRRCALRPFRRGMTRAFP